MGVYLTGLGTVTTLKTVTVRTQVDGQLVTEAFKEGQRVRAAELLGQIDPRAFQVQLEQAEGQAAKDAATLKNARVDLQRYQVLVGARGGAQAATLFDRLAAATVENRFDGEGPIAQNRLGRHWPITTRRWPFTARTR